MPYPRFDNGSAAWHLFRWWYMSIPLLFRPGPCFQLSDRSPPYRRPAHCNGIRRISRTQWQIPSPPPSARSGRSPYTQMYAPYTFSWASIYVPLSQTEASCPGFPDLPDPPSLLRCGTWS